MSHIVDFKIEGLLGRKDAVAFSLDRGLNIFFGANGSGKTSLLKILNSAMDIDASSLERVPFASASVDIYSESAKKVLTHSFVREEKDADGALNQIIHSESETISGVRTIWRSVTEPENWKISPPPARSLRRWAHKYLPTSRLYLGARGGESTLSDQRFDEHFEEEIQRVWSKYYSQVLTEIKDAQQRGLQNVLRSILANEAHQRVAPLNANEAYSRVKAFLMRQGNGAIDTGKFLGGRDEFGRRYVKDRILRSIVFDIDVVEQEIEAAYSTIELLQSRIAEMFSKGKQLSFSGPAINVETPDHRPVRIRDLSSGEKHLLRLLVDAVDAGGNTVIIDEPELSLHIDWQNSLMSCLVQLNPRAQFLVATHSPEVMANVPDRVIFKL